MLFVSNNCGHHIVRENLVINQLRLGLSETALTTPLLCGALNSPISVQRKYKGIY